MLEAPTRVEVICGSRSVQASAIAASVCPRPAAISFSARYLRESLLVQLVRRERGALGGGTRPLRDPVQIAVGEDTLRERREADAADPLRLERVEQLRLDPAVQHRVRRLVDHDRRAQAAADRGGFARLLRRVGGDARVEGLALPHRRVESPDRLLERCVRVEAVRVEDVDVLEAHPRERLVQARQHVLAGAAAPAVWAGPHVVAGLGRDDQLVAVWPQVVLEDPAVVLLGGAVGRPVVVREVVVDDAEIEGASNDRAAVLPRPVVPEVVPEPERHGRQLQPAAAAAAVLHAFVPVGGGGVHRADPNRT